MSFFNLRRRQIDVDKQMPVIFGEIPETELDTSHARGTVEVNVSNMPVEEQEVRSDTTAILFLEILSPQQLQMQFIQSYSFLHSTPYSVTPQSFLELSIGR